MTYRISKWADIYESHETRKLESLRYVFMPNKHDGLGFRRIAVEPNACELFGCWNLLVQIASKGRKGQRGILAREGVPLDATDCAVMTGFPSESFKRAFAFFSSPKMRWLEEIDENLPKAPAGPPLIPADPPLTSPGIEGRGEKGVKEGREGVPPLPSSLSLSEAEIKRLADAYSVTPEGITEGLARFNEIKANFPNDPRTSEAFRGWILTNAHGKEIRARHRIVKAKSGGTECPDWKTILNHEFPESIYSAGQSNEAHEWSDLPPEAQQLCWQTYKKQGAA